MPRLQHQDVERFRGVVARQFGLHYDESKLDFLADVLRGRMLERGLTSFDDYLLELDRVARGPDEVRKLAEQLTVNETYFFRNADNFAAFTEHVLPARVRENQSERRLSILSAGCASGEEPYSLAMALRETLPDFASWQVSILAIDVHPSMLEKATQARYAAWSLRATSPEMRAKYFRSEGRDFVLDPAVRSMVRFEERNLAYDDATLWRAASYDVVFCRNVIMYFTPEGMRAVVQRIARALKPSGFLFLGHAETLRGLSQDFHLCHTHDTFYYQARGAGEVAELRPRSTPPRAPFDGPTVADVEETTSWIDAIQHASQRIAALTRGPSERGERAEHGERGDVLGQPAGGGLRGWDLSLVLEALRQERFAEAMELLAALPPSAHAQPEALLLRAVLLANSGKPHEAEEACATLLRVDELNAGAHYVMALCREGTGDPKAAMEHDRTAIYLDAGFAMPHLHLGLIAKRAGDAATARYELSQAQILLSREEASRVLLFGGGFSREALSALCRTELLAVGGAT